jgi:hypothetical protein
MGIGDSVMSENEIRNQLASYLASDIPVEEFEDWIAQRTWNIHQSGDRTAEQLAYAIEAKLAEFSGGHIEETSLRRDLSPLVTDYTPELTVEWASIVHTPESSNLTAQLPFALLAPHCA